jgi:hypothetical protein
VRGGGGGEGVAASSSDDGEIRVKVLNYQSERSTMMLEGAQGW